MEQHTWVARVGISRFSSSLTQKFEPPTVQTHSITDAKSLELSPSVEAASAFQTHSEKLKE